MAEQRRHKRFAVEDGAFALLRSGPLKLSRFSDMGMGEIGFAVLRSNPIRLGPIKNMSRGGLAFQYVDGRTKSSNTLKLDILIAGCGFYLADLDYKIIFDHEIEEEPPRGPFKMRELSLRFRGLTQHQIGRLNFFLKNFSFFEYEGRNA